MDHCIVDEYRLSLFHTITVFFTQETPGQLRRFPLSKHNHASTDNCLHAFHVYSVSADIAAFRFIWKSVAIIPNHKRETDQFNVCIILLRHKCPVYFCVIPHVNNKFLHVKINNKK